MSAKDCKSYHPQKNSAWPNWKLVAAAGVSVIFLTLFLYFLSEKFRTTSEKLNQFTKDCIALDMDLFNQLRLNTRWALIRLLPQVLILVVLGVAGYEFYLGNEGEPLYWSEGVSMWPTELIRLFAGVLGCLFIADTASKVEVNKKQLSEFFCLKRNHDDPIFKIKDAICEEGGRVNVSKLWSWHDQKTSASSRNRRVLMNVMIFTAFGLSLLYVVGFPNVPYRGNASLLANILALIFCVSVFLILVMMVIDATWCSVDLIKPLIKYTSSWPKDTLRKFDLEQNIPSPEVIELTKLRDELSKDNKYYLNEWIDIQFIAAHTKEIGKLVYYPAIILILMIFARSKIFDNWNMPLGLTLIFLLSGSLTLFCALRLRRTAEQARKAVSKQISSMLIGLSSRPEKAARTLENQACIALKQIQDINEGAFLPLIQEPAVQALMLPFGGWGGITLLEYFVLNGF